MDPDRQGKIRTGYLEFCAVAKGKRSRRIPQTSNIGNLWKRVRRQRRERQWLRCKTPERFDFQPKTSWR